MAKKNVKVIYDTCRQITRQVTEMSIKGEEINQSLLQTLENAFADIIEFEKMFLIQCQDNFYGTILMDIDIKTDFSQRGSVDLRIKELPMTLAINPLFCSEYTFSEFTGLIVNELTKMVYLHPADFARLNKEKDPSKHEMLEKASEVSSTNVVRRDIRLENDRQGASKNGCRLPEDTYTSANLDNEVTVRSKENMPLEYYYNILKKFTKKQPPDNALPLPGEGDIATKGNNAGNPIHDWEGADEDEVKEQLTSIVSNAYNNLSEKARGMLPSSIAEQIKKLLAPPEINWKQVLRKMVGSIPVPYRKTRTRLNRRQPYRSDLCGKLPKRTVDVVCCFDTSGSMSDDDLKYCMNEVFNILKIYEGYKVTVIECDAEVQKVYQAKNLADLQLKMKGRGGTAFTPAIQYINGEKPYNDKRKYPLAGTFRNALMVYFTDGYGEYEIPKPKTYRNLWVVLKDEKCLSLKEPYGDVKSLSMDADYKKMKNGQ